MSPFEYDQLSKDERAELVFTKGNFVGEIKEYYGCRVVLYSLFDFWVEVFYNINDNVIDGIRHAGHVEIQKYLNRIKIDDVLPSYWITLFLSLDQILIHYIKTKSVDTRSHLGHLLIGNLNIVNIFSRLTLFLRGPKESEMLHVLIPYIIVSIRYEKLKDGGRKFFHANCEKFQLVRYLPKVTKNRCENHNLVH